ncbi:hypothetical protein ACTFIY_000311 [Dictyostelium cf. discoideum]
MAEKPLSVKGFSAILLNEYKTYQLCPFSLDKLSATCPKSNDYLALLSGCLNSLDGTIQCLEISRLFWLQVNDKINNLIDIDTLNSFSEIVQHDVELNFEFFKNIKSSGLNWLAFAFINYTISNSISSIKTKLD